MRKILLTVAAVVVALSVGEGATRLFFRHKDFPRWQAAVLRYRADPCYGWKVFPGKYVRSLEVIHINSLGLRGPEISERKEPGEIRVLVLGGSSAFNSNSEGGNTWPRLLEKKLQKRFGPSVRVINAATPGYSVYQSAKRLECQLLGLSPDLVLVYHLWNDVKNFSTSDVAALVRRLEAWGRFNERSTLNFLTGRIPVFDELTRWSQLAARLRFALVKLVRHFNKVGDEGRKRGSLKEKVHPNGVDFYRRNLLSVRSLLAGRKIPLFIVKQAMLVNRNNSPRERKRIIYKYSGFDHATLLEAIREGWRVNEEVCRLDGVRCIAANERVPATLDDFRDHVHPTARGRRALAEAVYGEVAKWVEERIRASRPPRKRLDL